MTIKILNWCFLAIKTWLFFEQVFKQLRTKQPHLFWYRCTGKILLPLQTGVHLSWNVIWFFGAAYGRSVHFYRWYAAHLLGICKAVFVAVSYSIHAFGMALPYCWCIWFSKGIKQKYNSIHKERSSNKWMYRQKEPITEVHWCKWINLVQDLCLWIHKGFMKCATKNISITNTKSYWKWQDKKGLSNWMEPLVTLLFTNPKMSI